MGKAPVKTGKKSSVKKAPLEIKEPGVTKGGKYAKVKKDAKRL